MKWQTTVAFLLIIPLIMIFLWDWLTYERRRASLLFSSKKLFTGLQKGWRAKLAFLPKTLQFIAILLAIVALARPQKANTKVNRDVEGIDIMLTLDVSDSMDIEDMEPDDRLGAAKSVIRKFIQGRVSDRIGLIIFAGESYTRCPLTLDYKVLLESLETASTDNIKQGTAIGVSLANAVARLKESTAKSRVIILLTDGESNTGTIDPLTALDIAKGYGIKVYTIGVGVNGQAQLPVYTTDFFGRKVKTYQAIQSKVNDGLLQKIADDTGGRYYRAVDTGALKKVFSDIDRLEKSKVHVHEYVRYTELFTDYLWWAFALYLMQFVLSRSVLRRVP